MAAGNIVQIILSTQSAPYVKGMAAALIATKALRNSIIGLTAAVAGLAIIEKTTRDYAAFEKQLKNVSTLGNFTAESMKRMEHGALAMSQEVNQFPTDLVRGFYQSISRGAKGASEAMETTRVAAMLASAGFTSTDTAVKVLRAAINQYGLEVKDTIKVSDQLFKTVAVGGIDSVNELATSLGKALPAAKAAGVRLSEVNAGIAVLTQGGFTAEEAVTALRNTFLAFVKGADKFRDVGINILDVIGERGLLGGLDALKRATGGNIEEVREFIPNIRSLQAVLGLVGEQYDDFTDSLKKIEGASGDTRVAFDKQSESLAFQSKQLSVGLRALSISFGTIFAPAVKIAVSILSDFVRNLTLAIDAKAKLESFTGGIKDKNIGKSLLTAANAAQSYRLQIRELMELEREKEKALKKGSKFIPWQITKGISDIKESMISTLTVVEQFADPETARKVREAFDVVDPKGIRNVAAIATIENKLREAGEKKVKKEKELADFLKKRLSSEDEITESLFSQFKIKKEIAALDAKIAKMTAGLLKGKIAGRKIDAELVSEKKKNRRFDKKLLEDAVNDEKFKIDSFIKIAEQGNVNLRVIAKDLSEKLLLVKKEYNDKNVKLAGHLQSRLTEINKKINKEDTKNQKKYLKGIDKLLEDVTKLRDKFQKETKKRAEEEAKRLKDIRVKFLGENITLMESLRDTFAEGAETFRETWSSAVAEYVSNFDEMEHRAFEWADAMDEVWDRVKAAMLQTLITEGLAVVGNALFELLNVGKKGKKDKKEGGGISGFFKEFGSKFLESFGPGAGLKGLKDALSNFGQTQQGIGGSGGGGGTGFGEGSGSGGGGGGGGTGGGFGTPVAAKQAFPDPQSQGSAVVINNLEIFPGATIDEAVMNMPQEKLVKWIRKGILPALNSLGDKGATISTRFKTSR